MGLNWALRNGKWESNEDSRDWKFTLSARADSPGLFYFRQGRPLEAPGPLIASEYGPLRCMAGYALLGRGEKSLHLFNLHIYLPLPPISIIMRIFPPSFAAFSILSPSLSFAAFANIFFYSNVVFILPSILSPPADPPWSNRTLVGDLLPSQ